MTLARVFVCEAHPIVLEGLKRVLNAAPDLEFAGCVESLDLALPQLLNIRPELFLVDQSAGLRPVIQFLGEVRRSALPVKTAVWVTKVEDLERFRLMEAGVDGIVGKQATVHALLECLRCIRDGKIWVDGVSSAPAPKQHYRRSDPRLTPRERDIVRLVNRGMTNREIAKELSIAQGTVKVHLMHVFEKTGVRDRMELSIGDQSLGGPPEVEAAPEQKTLAISG